MLDDVASNCNDGGEGDEDVGTDVCNINILRRLNSHHLIGPMQDFRTLVQKHMRSDIHGTVLYSCTIDKFMIIKLKMTLAQRSVNFIFTVPWHYIICRLNCNLISNLQALNRIYYYANDLYSIIYFS